ncbi:GGDEF domain-containing protein [Ancylobacter sp. A5.8]|uniref:GGDEF domain-containing protein n=1 Tax=Ancylobacter gelatini TaxID=2919920 RepID=UPI001F4EEEA1|nr:GGDEF domain-containing protein [Ancylobacter gelatini]MCJ8142125.1 GGDEF domain-containing protein [Ancylobacter gelatini]
MDLFTLYTVVLFKGLALSLLWCAIWRLYGQSAAARHWMLSNLAALAGGLIMALETRSGPLSPAILGNTLVIVGFFLNWAGLRRFFGRPAPWIASLLAPSLALCVLIAFDDSRLVRNLVYALGQSIPLVLCLPLLVGARRHTGAPLALVSILAAIAAIMLRYGGLVMHNAGQLSDESYNVVLFGTLLVTIFGGFVWNFGFLLLVIERLHSEAHSLAVVDELTGLPNRRMFTARMEAEKELSEREGRGFALLLIDVDRFKGINDEYGHAAGDACLTHFSRLVAGRVRKGDLLARLGGDEFCVLLSDTGLEPAAVIAGEIVELMDRNPLFYYGTTIPVTLSIGIAIWQPKRHATIAELVEEADSALYLAKRRGRNRYALPEAVPQFVAPPSALRTVLRDR